MPESLFPFCIWYVEGKEGFLCMDVILTGVDSEQVVMDMAADADEKEAEEEKAMAVQLLF